MVSEDIENCKQEEMMKDNRKLVGAAFLIGGVVGSALALIYAPQSGRKTRRDISKTARRVKNKATDVIEDAIDDINDFTDNLREMASGITDQGLDLTDKARREIVRALEHGQGVMEKQKKRISQSLGL
jgi:gas vesicle protein